VPLTRRRLAPVSALALGSSAADKSRSANEASRNVSERPFTLTGRGVRLSVSAPASGNAAPEHDRVQALRG
jgi:hypothetical protein